MARGQEGSAPGTEFQVNSHTTLSQTFPAISADRDGDFIVVWESFSQDGSAFGVFGQRFDGDGIPQGGEFQVNVATINSQRRPVVALVPTGEFVVAWSDSSQDGNQAGVFGRRFDSTGSPLGGEFQVNTYTFGVQDDPAVSADGLGNFVVVWDSYQQDSSSYGVFGRRYDSAGTPQGIEFLVNSHVNLSQSTPTVAINASGDFVVAWQSYAQDGGAFGVFARGFGGVATGEFRVNTHTAGNQYDPHIAINDSGDFVVVWTDNILDGNLTGVFARIYDSNGTPLGDEFQVNTYTTGHQRRPSVAMGDTGNFMVLWESQQDGDGFGIFGQRFDAAGMAQGIEFQVNTFTAGAQTLAALSGDRSQDFVAAWVDSTEDGSVDGVFGQMLPCLPLLGTVTDFDVQLVNSGEDLLFTWADTADATAYTVFEDSLPGGSFLTVAGVATSGDPGLTVPVPGGTRFYLVGAQSETCFGPKR